MKATKLKVRKKPNPLIEYMFSNEKSNIKSNIIKIVFNTAHCQGIKSLFQVLKIRPVNHCEIIQKTSIT